MAGPGWGCLRGLKAAEPLRGERSRDLWPERVGAMERLVRIQESSGRQGPQDLLMAQMLEVEAGGEGTTLGKNQTKGTDQGRDGIC